jgi:hypothetical protein
MIRSVWSVSHRKIVESRNLLDSRSRIAGRERVEADSILGDRMGAITFEVRLSSRRATAVP